MKIETISMAVIALSCTNPAPKPSEHFNQTEQNISIPENKIGDINLPKGFSRINTNDSFALWLRNIELKKEKTVYLFNGQQKNNQQAQYAVLNIPVPKVDLQQCADAVMRLRAEYLFSQKKYSEIYFTDNEGKTYKFASPYTKEHFHKYLLQVFGMCGTASLSKQLKTKASLQDIEPGDVLIRGGFPGHAVIVVDVAQNAKKQKVYMLAQSYMPAQDIHILQNPNDDNSPWYTVNDERIIQTPEYTFHNNELKTW